MDTVSSPGEELWQRKYDNLRKNRDGIQRQLRRTIFSPDRKKCLEWQLENIEEAIKRHLNNSPRH